MDSTGWTIILVVVILVIGVAIIYMVADARRPMKIRRYKDSLHQCSENLRKKAELLESGVPDTYDNDGMLIRGIPPDVDGAISIYKQIYKSGDRTAVVEIIRVMIDNIYMHPSFIQLVEKYIAIGLQHKDLEPLVEEQKSRLHDMLTVETFDVAEEEVVPAAVTTIPPVVQEAPIPVPQGRNHEVVPYRLDAQNVHDHSVVKTTDDAISAIRASMDPSDNIDQLVVDYRSHVNMLPYNDRRVAIEKVLYGIESDVTPIDIGGSSRRLNDPHHGGEDIGGSSNKLTEREILGLVVGRIKHYPKDKIQDALSSLDDSLSTGVENGNVVCTRGRIGRIVNSLSGIDRQVRIVDTGGVREEMMRRASKLRDEIGDTPTFKDTLKDTLKKEYVDTGLMTDAAFGGEVNQWIDLI